ncbi:DgyrCDS12494 [Dimorphilus gyrociliatus]|uniref:DgyrCDS12494 n=1 Tax=Dimorphilus gyrociliatus TaxID=2664684 RepID=A0A7I8W888_9ANNE|nr:DgyrCDS12494 [Dimorphilus gyrociliatus]
MDEDNIDKEKYLQKASHIWSMLNDMRETDPAKYRKFIDEQLKAGKEIVNSRKPIEPHMCLKVQFKDLDEKKNLYINFVTWNRLPEPKSETHPVPIAGGPIYDISNDSKSITVALNSKVLEEMGRNGSPEKRECLIGLTISFIEENRNVKLRINYEIEGDNKLYHGDLKTIVNSLLKAYNQKADDSMEYLKEFAPIASLLPEHKTVNEVTTEDIITRKSSDNENPDIIIPGVNEKATKTCLIEEVAPKYLTPTYKISDEIKEGVPTYLMKISLPGVKASSCDLDMSETDLVLKADNYELEYKFKKNINWERVSTKFSKKNNLLTITIPQLV